MPSDGSITHLLEKLRAGDPAAAQQLWERYFRRLVALARKKLQGAPRRAADEEDVALSAFDGFCRCAEQGRFPDLVDRESLWRLLVVLTARKAANLVRDEARLKRVPRGAGGGQESEDGLLDRVLSREPDPEFAAEMAEVCRRLLRKLADAELESVALRRMEGYTVEEIAVQLGRAPRTVKRWLAIIRGLWESEGVM
ncbi:MAG TPA: RNA polymerase subunit sigma-70 [Planctomycetales bacterium]|jgi:RNA polymerase sigma factor (sigma-70 family)|nr:RNA polymerase subunit sigma-70 [Planctomycetales bacterium]